MQTILGRVLGITLVISMSGCTQPQTGIQAAAEAMGTANLTSIQYSGSGSAFAFGQAVAPGERWPRFEAKSYAVGVDYQTPAMRVETVRVQGERPPRGGGGQPLAGHYLQDSGHNTATLIAYLPAERILMYGDGYNPPPGDDPRDPSRTPEYGMDLYKNVQRLKLNVARIAPVHGRVVPFDNMKTAIGVPSLSN